LKSPGAGYLQSGSAGLDYRKTACGPCFPVCFVQRRARLPTRAIMLRPAVLSKHRGQVAGESLRGRLAGSSAQGTCMYQATNTATANTITPAQYQPRSASSLIGTPPFFPGGIIHPSPTDSPFRAGSRYRLHRNRKRLGAFKRLGEAGDCKCLTLSALSPAHGGALLFNCA